MKSETAVHSPTETTISKGSKILIFIFLIILLAEVSSHQFGVHCLACLLLPSQQYVKFLVARAHGDKDGNIDCGIVSIDQGHFGTMQKTQPLAKVTD